jgi:trehalose 6-phosphate synthase
MVTFSDLQSFFKQQQRKLIIVADGEPYVSVLRKGKMVLEMHAGGVAVALDPIARATNALYIARAKSEEERSVLDKKNKMVVGGAEDKYTLKRLFFSEQEFDDYYFGFSNQVIWPLCHVAFEQPILNDKWLEGYKQVNQKYAQAIKEELNGKNFVWINDYQLAMVPYYLGKPKDTVVGMFWHIPWPTWEIFRILPYKKEILISLLSCDFLAFHRGYQARNFLNTVERELEVRIDQETQQVYFNKHVTTVKHLPLGIDTDVVKALVKSEEKQTPTVLTKAVKFLLGTEEKEEHPFDWYFKKYKVILGVDRLDYTKGIPNRLRAIKKFFEKNPQYIGKVVYLGIIAPSREKIPSYKKIRQEIRDLAANINETYAKKNWKPINLIYDLFKREDMINFYRKADVCMITPLDDGMNLVSKEFVIASSLSHNPGMLVLSQFAGSAIDLTEALIINPYDTRETANAIKQGLEMKVSEKVKRIKHMADMQEDKNVYEWGYDFIKEAIQSAR